MHRNKIENLIKMDAEDRYRYFLRKVADYEEVWGLKGANGWLTVDACDHGRIGVPLWPEKEFAVVNCVGEWARANPEKIELSVFIERWIPGLIRDNRVISVFPVVAGKSVHVDPRLFLSEIEKEMDQYE
ncbi:DUF2750 domain-containing protein [Xanthomonas medicagonis]|uniref:DUF2750 domain-containing protein n=1 Tax=Xanthomonas medicagonis TaxID=3160841 RepID=UPI0035139F97